MTREYKSSEAARAAAKAYYHARKDDPVFMQRQRAKSNARRARAVAEGTVQEWDRNAHLSKHYGITLIEWEEMFKAQNYRCAVCGSQDPRRKAGGWATDHDHGTGKVRGILCAPCNNGLGCLLDSPDVLRSAIAYLERNR